MAKGTVFTGFHDGQSVERQGSKNELAVAAGALRAELYFAILGARNALLQSEPEAVRLVEQPAIQPQDVASPAMNETVAPVIPISNAPSYRSPEATAAAVVVSDANTIDLNAPDVPLTIDLTEINANVEKAYLDEALDNIARQKAEQRRINAQRSLLRYGARLGGEVFGPIPAGHRREFFCLDRHAWVWHEEWVDAEGKRQVVTTRYDVRPNGILKSQGDQSYQRLSTQEARNLYQAMQLYYERFGSELQRIAQAI